MRGLYLYEDKTSEIQFLFSANNQIKFINVKEHYFNIFIDYTRINRVYYENLGKKEEGTKYGLY